MPASGADSYTDITAHVSKDGRIARIAFHRPEVRNAFRPRTVDELYTALDIARQDPRIGVVLLTGNGPSPKDGGWAFCSGGAQRIRGRDGYKYEQAVAEPAEARDGGPSTGSGTDDAVAGPSDSRDGGPSTSSGTDDAVAEPVDAS